MRAKLPDAVIRNHLVELTCDKVDQITFNLFVKHMYEAVEIAELDLTLHYSEIFDCCGTGGSGLAHYNTSTTVAFVLAAGGIDVAKFGNRSATSLSGSFDFLESIGLAAQVPPKAVSQLIAETGLVFLFAQQYYPVLEALSRIRRSINGSTIFNFLGPLLNPLRPNKRLIGTGNPSAHKLIANYLAKDKQTKRAFVIRAENGLDELDPCGRNHILDISPESVKSIEGFHSQIASFQPTMSLTPEENARVFHELLHTPLSCGYFLDLVCLNSAAAFFASENVFSIDEGMQKSRELLISGAVKDKFEQCKRAYGKFIG